MSIDHDALRDPVAFSANELDSMFRPVVGGAERVALAVSGGSDSVALLVLFCDWLKHAGPSCRQAQAVTVDHGLRAGSAAEAAQVAALAARFDLPHVTLVWDGRKPATGIAAAAREARYGLIAAHMRQTGMSLLLTAHTRDDQAETLLMRLARGSGVDGLAAMPPLGPLGPAPTDLCIGRPLLGVGKPRLAQLLAQRGIAWAEDPTNHDQAYERPRLRAGAEALAAAGLTPAALALAARRVRRARTALEHVTRAQFDPALGHCHVDPRGFVALRWQPFAALPEEISLRVLRAAIQCVGGSPEPVSLAAVEDVHRALLGKAGDGAWTLARAAVRRKGERVLVEREPGRQALPQVPLHAGALILWDGRFAIATGQVCPAGCHVGALTAEGLALVEAAGRQRPEDCSAQVLRALPAVWQGPKLLVVPALDYRAEPALQLDIDMRFRGLAELAAQRAR